MRTIIIATKQALTYAILFILFLTGILCIFSLNIYKIVGTDYKALVLVTYYLTINSFLVRRSITNRIVWNLMFIPIPAVFLFVTDLSLPAIALKIIAHVPLIGTWAERTGSFLKMPEALMWALVSCTYGWIIGLIDFEELPAFERQIILRLEWLKYRL